MPRRRGENGDGVGTKSNESTKRGETVEAVLSRLSKAYSVSMECLGSLHQLESLLHQKHNEEEKKESLESMRKLAKACRDTLENAVLLDPLIVAPTLRHTIQQFADRDKEQGPVDSSRWENLCKPRPEPPKITSKAHRSTLRQVSYLALTNYADLLMSVCTYSCARKPSPHRNQQLLDRGVVKKLKGLVDNFETIGCSWAQDTEEDIQRLALVALCDASSLDGTDPVVWIKLACAARAMGHIECLPDGGLVNPMLSPFRRLERHALESGYKALPSNVPPNRAIARALQEFNADELPSEYPPVLAPEPEQVKLSLDLTRYSWSQLGRLLMKAMREGTGANESEAGGQGQVVFGSPSISLRISSMLLLPSSVLTRILSFMETQSIWKFEATCRALSVSIMSVRAALEKQGVQAKQQDGHENSKELDGSEQPPMEIETKEGVPMEIDKKDESPLEEGSKKHAQGETKDEEDGPLKLDSKEDLPTKVRTSEEVAVEVGGKGGEKKVESMKTDKKEVAVESDGKAGDMEDWPTKLYNKEEREGDKGEEVPMKVKAIKEVPQHVAGKAGGMKEDKPMEVGRKDSVPMEVDNEEKDKKQEESMEADNEKKVAPEVDSAKGAKKEDTAIEVDMKEEESQKVDKDTRKWKEDTETDNNESKESTSCKDVGYKKEDVPMQGETKVAKNVELSSESLTDPSKSHEEQKDREGIAPGQKARKTSTTNTGANNATEAMDEEAGTTTYSSAATASGDVEDSTGAPAPDAVRTTIEAPWGEAQGSGDAQASSDAVAPDEATTKTEAPLGGVQNPENAAASTSKNQEERDKNMSEKEEYESDTLPVHDGTATAGSAGSAAPGGNAPAPAPAPAPKSRPLRFSSRSSQRVRSQQMSENKKDERLRKRKSVDFCLCSATLGTAPSTDSKELKLNKTTGEGEGVVWDRVFGSCWQLPAVTESRASTAAGAKAKASSTENSRQRFEAEERIGASSLSSFLQRMSARRADPTTLLGKYLGHIALHVEEVFAVDPGDTVVLTASIMGSLELLMEKKSEHKLLPQFFDHEDLSSGCSIDQSMELFAIDLLNVELRFKTCERQQTFSFDFDDDSNFVCCMTPVLLGGMAHLDEMVERSGSNPREWIKLKTRVNWLVAGVYLWRSRLTTSVCESIEAEELGMKYIDATIDCLSIHGESETFSVATPHLESPVFRTAMKSKHLQIVLCRETVCTYRDEIQASSVVSHAQQQFQERVANITKRSNDTDKEKLTEEDVSNLSGIGETLLTRYKAPFGSSESKHGELLDNFISIHGDGCLSGNGDMVVADAETIDAYLPVTPVNVKIFAEMPNTSILTILVACLQVQSSNHKAIVVLLVRLLLTALNRHEQICLSAASKSESTDNFSDSEDGESVDNDAGSDLDQGENGGASKNDAIKCGRMVNFLLEKVLKSMLNLTNEAEREAVAASHEFLQALHHSLGFCSSWISYFAQQPSSLEEVLDRKVFVSTCALLRSFLDGGDNKKLSFLKELHLGGLVRILEAQQKSFASLVRVQGAIRARRAVRQRICNLRAEFIAVCLCELSKDLSEHLFTVNEGKMERASILEAPLFEKAGTATTSSSPTVQVQILCDTLLWFNRYSKEAEDNPTNSFDRPILERLRVPLVAATVSFCGSGSRTRLQASEFRANDHRNQTSDTLCLKDFLDSDASAHEYSDNEEERSESGRWVRRELLRVLCHLVHCVALVFGKVDEKEIVSFDSDFYNCEHGPLLPLVVTRVLNHVADTLLVEFADDESESDAQGVWEPKYPFGTGATGFLLDSALYKAYKCLHGFTLTSSNDFYSGKEIVLMTSSDLEIKRCHSPESHKAAAQLYRCIVRAGKKTPPKAALEAVSSALPPLKESRKSRMISNFLFSTDTKRFDVEDISMIASENQGWTSCFAMVKSWDETEESGLSPMDDNDETQSADPEGKGLDAEAQGESSMVGGSNKSCAKTGDAEKPTEPSAYNTRTEKKEDNKATDDEVMFLRKGVFALLAQGELPAFSSGDFVGKDDDRAGAKRFEEELSKKFIAIFNTLKYGDTNDITGWFRAAQCLMFKADVVAERLGMSKGFSRSKNFFMPDQRVPAVDRLSLAALEEKQEKEMATRRLGWVQHIGEDLSLYVSYQWSSLSSLTQLSDFVLLGDENSHSTGEDEVKAFMSQVKKEIHEMQDKGRLAEWQQAWGGMFVTALKKMAMRCMCLAIYLFHKNSSAMRARDKDLIPEIFETMGMTLYSCLLGSQTYGYPMHVTSAKRKRQVAEASRACFQRAIDLAKSAPDGEDSDTWDLVFIIGKCHEKIASTYKSETYQCADSATDSKPKRVFEQLMSKALDSYCNALDDKPQVDTEAGGSSHGVTEIFYRLHASRLKCLLESAVASEGERAMAEEEALRLTEKHWFSPPSDPSALEKTPVRDRVWNVLADIVSALAQCRLEHAFFHRSVYRHAQALMWAPLLSDPVLGRLKGSKSTVPATRSYHIRGLNHATDAARSALAVMTSLFEKKRSQLCAVWVTTTYPPTPFESLNNSARKYDSLRGKYISAYIDCLRLCGNRTELETLLRWLSSSKRDLPSLYQASAKTEGGKPEKSHSHDALLKKGSVLSSFNLLTGLKRQANSAMARVLTEELSSDDPSVKPQNHLKLAYACFLRLNCSVKELKKTRAWKYDPHGVWEAEAVCRAFLKLEDRESIQVDPNDWSGAGHKAAVLDAALRKCKLLFSSVTANYYSKKINQKVKSQEEAETKDSSDKPGVKLSGSKRSFEVKVPEGLAEGESFTTTITSGENAKKVKLTVPSGKPRMLRFSLDLSTQSHD